MTRERPRYRGMHRHLDVEGGYSLWLPSDWREIPMTEGHHGVIFTPYPDRIDTSFAAEKRILEYPVTEEDIPVLREGFYDGLKALPGVEIESTDETITPTLKVFEARFTFLEDGIRRKRWVRNIFWAEGQLILIAQGATEEEFAYWEGMFYNTMMTAEIL
ncbi:MAG TPA: hypothetical protein ENL34_11190 [Chloroflexi bacterium]|nr:hypothetical protein [Chloroflexota bacterium]